MFRSRYLSSSRTITMFSPSRVSPIISPARSTPSLDYDSLDYYESPPDDYLATPDISEWREIRRLEAQKMLKDDDSTLDASYQFELPSLDILSHNQRPLLSELPPQLPPWPHSTIAPKDAFPDYQEVRKFLQEQARPSSPSAFSVASSSSLSPFIPSHFDDLDFVEERDIPVTRPSPSSDAQPTPSTSTASPAYRLTPPTSTRRVGKKAKREDDDEYTLTPKRRMLPSHCAKSKSRAISPSDDEEEEGEDYCDDNTADFDDESGDFRPARRQPQQRRKANSGLRGPSRATPGRPRATVRRTAPHPKKSNRGEDYQEGPCDCQDDKCTNCQMTCFYTFVHGARKGEVCKRLFESARHLDLKRHKATHAVQEWKWLQDGEITPDMAYWYSVVFEGKEHGLMCPNGDCTTTFTRYDALKRHMERSTCQYRNLESTKDGLDNRQIKARIIRESDEKYERVAAAARAVETQQT